MNTGHTTFTVEEAKRKLEYYCSYQDRCHEEVLQKLRSLRMIPEAIEHIMAHLISENFLNEERFACSFARGKFRIKKWGKRRIVQELKLKGISKYNIDKGLKEIDPNEYFEAFNELSEKLWEQTKETSLLKKKRKVLDNLVRKGFEYELISEKIEELSR